MVEVGVGHRGVLAHDVESLDVALVHLFGDLHHREARVGVERHAPKLLEELLGFWVAHGLVVREDHRDQPHVGRALHVVLAAQGVQSGSGTPDLPRHQREGDEAAGVVSAVDVL